MKKGNINQDINITKNTFTHTFINIVKISLFIHKMYLKFFNTKLKIFIYH